MVKEIKETIKLVKEGASLTTLGNRNYRWYSYRFINEYQKRYIKQNFVVKIEREFGENDLSLREI